MKINLIGNKDFHTENLIFNMLDILAAVGMPMNLTDRRKERMAMACLAAGKINSDLSQAKSVVDGDFLTTRSIIEFINLHFSENMSPGSYDDIRRQDLLYPLAAGLVINSASVDSQATNNPRRGYSLSEEFANLIKSYGLPQWDKQLALFRKKQQSLLKQLSEERDLSKIPVCLPNGVKLELSTGEHNKLQKAIIEEFLPRFGMGAQVLYVGDTSNKQLYKNDEILREIDFFNLSHEELPDIIALCREKNILFLIEAVYSSGPMSEIRVKKLEQKLVRCKVRPIYITCFMDKKVFRKWVADIAWETEVWIAESPDHMIHFNGFKFLEINK